MDTMHEGMTPATRRRLDDAMEVASRLAGTDAIGAIHITLVGRPTYDELYSYRQLAEANGLRLTMTANSIILRPRPVYPATKSAPAPGLAALLPNLGHVAGEAWRKVHERSPATAAVVRARSGAQWLHDHAAGWNAGFQGLSEGTR
jgi:hypothetical protein